MFRILDISCCIIISEVMHMNDKAIRKILIEYLHLENPEARIYQEKLIGSSVCDVMSVSDSLTGYEIKSDCDNFQRLSRQIKSYTEFFDYNYLVVSDCHKDAASSKVPESWGIILIQDNGIHLQRKARRNKGFSLRVRLSVLWKIELKNILVRNKLPDYASKSKEYIISRIVDSLNPEILSRHITEELLKRDYSIYGNTAEYSETEEGINPLAELVDTVSEQDFEKFTLDKWIEIYNSAKGIRDKKEKALRPVRASDPSHRIKYTDISVSMGVPWISVHIIEEFIKELLEIIYNYKLVSYEPVTGSWHIYNKNGFRENLKCIYTYGTDKWNCLHIIEATLNLREIKICNSRGKYDETETLAVLEKQKLINQKFSEWIWQDEDRIWEIEEAYNNMFPEKAPETINVARVTIPAMNSEYKLYDYQKYAVQRITNQKNTLLAYDVGSGKTLIMIAAAMKMRREGISRKNMFVVPNNITSQWEKTFYDIYPEAKILTVDPEIFKPGLREKVLHQLQCGDYDGIIIAYSCFEMIPLSQKYLSDNLRHRLLALADEAHKISAQGDSVTAVNREMSYVSKLVTELMKSTESILNEITIPDKVIAFIHSYSTDLKKLELYDKFNRGEIRILIGSTLKLGTGANVQKRLKALHHLDAPWRPADMVQREGRILRMGNENDQVYIFRYITEGSFDAYSWQILETKQRFISQFLSGSAYQRSISDLESNVLSYGEVKALALSCPIMRDYAEKENYLRSFRILSNSHIQHLSKVRNELETAEIKMEEINAKLKESEKKPVSEKRYQKLLTQKEQCTAIINNTKKELRKKNPYTDQIQKLQKEIEDIRKKIHEDTFENSVDPALPE